MKMPMEEFIESVKDEILCYENMEEIALRWEKEFAKWLEKNKGHHKDVVEEKGRIFFRIKDEDEIFEAADSYIDAKNDDNFKGYWEKF